MEVYNFCNIKCIKKKKEKIICHKYVSKLLNI